MYEFRYNVALDGKHVFRTDWYLVASINNVFGVRSRQVTAIAAILLEKFPKAEGYSVKEQRRNSEITDIDITD